MTIVIDVNDKGMSPGMVLLDLLFMETTSFLAYVYLVTIAARYTVHLAKGPPLDQPLLRRSPIFSRCGGDLDCMSHRGLREISRLRMWKTNSEGCPAGRLSSVHHLPCTLGVTAYLGIIETLESVMY